MNGGEIKKVATNQAKKVATVVNNATNGNGQKKRRKGGDLKPIITTEGPQSSEASPSATINPNNLRSVIYADAQLLPKADTSDLPMSPTNVISVRILPTHTSITKRYK